MSKTLGHPDDLEFTRDLEIIARGLNGKGAALQRMLDRADVTQQSVADHLGCNRSAISHWVREERWPTNRTILEVLKVLGVDAALLQGASEILIGEDVAGELFRKCGNLNSFSVTKDQLVELVKNEDDFTRRDMLFKILYPMAILAQGLRAAGLKGGESADPRAAQWLSSEYDKHKEEAARRDVGKERQVSSAQLRAAAGDIYEKPAHMPADPPLDD